MTVRTDRKHGQADWVVSPPDELHPFLTGEEALRLSDCYAPSAKEVRRMLLALRARLRWSQGFAAAVFGVGRSTIVKWEAGSRTPIGTSRKLVFLIYKTVFEQGRIKNFWDLALWGAVPCRASTPQAIHLAATHFVPQVAFNAEDSSRARSALEQSTPRV